ncbi:DNA helicase [Pararhodospirillum oryzae]|uniref:DNA helicase n=2 Tax=Pararhodospirillum oryzae TaxID=478448 RepID=A0A512H8C9_9PROT|nr:DNA helicase [Pararhodospirillum oryzae]
MTLSSSPSSAVALPPVPALVVQAGGGVLLHPDGEIETLAGGRAAESRLNQVRPLVCHRPHAARRLGLAWFAAHDVLELFAFVRPARFCAPTPRGLARVMGLPVPSSTAEEARTLAWAALALLDDLAVLPPGAATTAEARALAHAMAQGGWAWGGPVLAALGGAGEVPPPAALRRALAVWRALPEVEEEAPLPPPGAWPVAPREARARLAALLGTGAETRPQQADYASAVCAAFEPRLQADQPRVVLAEAGTGVGKTLGYIAPASLWAERNEGTVWISTYTRNLQRQLDRELDRLYPEPEEKARQVVVRKGRENYLCLLNLEEAMARVATLPTEAVALGLMARWVRATRDGDIGGGDFPGWLTDLLGTEPTVGLADRRGECLFSACEHVHRCFIERALRRARRARLVVANHALVMVQAALGGLDDDTRPGRYVFDEGHHVFDAADAAFSAHLTAVEAAEVRRWLVGAEAEGGRSRARGLKRRIEGLIDPDGEAAALLTEALEAARSLPGPAWPTRLGGGTARGAVEHFLVEVRAQVLARAAHATGPHSLEVEVRPPAPGLLDSGRAVAAALSEIVVPLKALAGLLAKRLDAEADTLDTATRTRLESMVRSIERRAVVPLSGWQAMAAGLGDPEPPADFVEWLALERIEGREVDVGLHRHWIDPTRPFAQTLGRRAHGLVVTSATLRDGAGEEESTWRAAEARLGLGHLGAPVIRAAVPSPFDYQAATRVLGVTDVSRDEPDQVAAAFRALFMAAGGGALGLFTAVARLKAVHARLAPDLEAAGLPLYAQHVDAMDIGTLIAIFREEEDACLLGTDAVRDGVDVPGRSLRLIVFDRVPWPRPDILHKARRALWGGPAYDDRLTRLRLKQAFGRLVRRAGDRGVFVMLDPRFPSRLGSAFPPGVAIERVGLAEAVAIVREHES